MHRKTVLISATLILLARLVLIAATGYPSHATAGQTATSAGAAPVVTVLIRQFKFEPATLTVHEGDTVEWKNEDDVPHTATADDNTFDSGNIDKGATWRYVAQKKGTSSYICSLHPNMHAKLIVQ